MRLFGIRRSPSDFCNSLIYKYPITLNSEIKFLLDAKVNLYEQASFIESDPIQIPKQFSRKEDIEIAGFMAATFAWGQRPMIIKKSNDFIRRMQSHPYTFIMQADEKEFKHFADFVYRTFNGDDSLFFLAALRHLYREYGGLEQVFSTYADDPKRRIQHFRQLMLQTPHLKRSEKHLADPMQNSAAKRINMFLRWMVRPATNGVDFGIWKNINPASLMIPLDVHSARIARQLKLLHRKQNDWKAVEELTDKLRQFDPADPVRYDFAIFGMGAFE